MRRRVPKNQVRACCQHGVPAPVTPEIQSWDHSLVIVSCEETEGACSLRA